MTCDHTLVPTRQLEFRMVEDPAPWMRGHFLRQRDGGGDQIVVDRTDGLGCPKCGHFVPNDKPQQ